MPALAHEAASPGAAVVSTVYASHGNPAVAGVAENVAGGQKYPTREHAGNEVAEVYAAAGHTEPAGHGTHDVVDSESAASPGRKPHGHGNHVVPSVQSRNALVEI